MNFLAEYAKAKQIQEEIKTLSEDKRYELLYWLFCDGTFSYAESSKRYVAALQAKNEDNNLLLSEAETIICEDLNYQECARKPRIWKEILHKHIHRALYFLNQGKRIRMDSLNEHFGYNEEEDRELSFYYRTSKMRQQ